MRLIAALLILSLIGSYAHATYPSVPNAVVRTYVATGTSHVVTQATCAATGDTEFYAATLGFGLTASSSGYTQLSGGDGSADISSHAYWRKSPGGAPGTVTFTVSGAGGTGIWASWCVTGAVDPAVYPPLVGTAATGTGTTPDPPNVTPSYGIFQYLVCAVSGWDADPSTTMAASAFPYTLYNTSFETDAINRDIGLSCEQLNVASANPGTFTIPASQTWRAQTIFIRGTGLARWQMRRLGR